MDMYLTKWEERALRGELGEGVRVALEVLVKVCRALKAERLVEVRHAHVSGVSYFNIGDSGLELLEDLVGKGAKASIYTTANPSSIAVVDVFRGMYGEGVVAKQRRIVDLLIEMGIDRRSFTCTPYKLRTPSPGEHLAWAESSAVIYANSILGAKTNREGGITALMAAITGRTCFSGMHIDSNRLPTEVIRVEFPIDTISTASALGLYVGSVTRGVPYVKVSIKLDGRLKDVALRSMLASIASTSSSSLALIEGLSPEARNLDLTGLEKISVDVNEVKRFVEDTCSNSLYLGCPHIDLAEFREVLGVIANKYGGLKIRRIYVSIPMYEAERLSNLVDIADGVEVIYMPGACPVVSDLRLIGLDIISTVHGKAYHYIPRLAGARACLSSIA